ncbi:MAG: hypothetical protein ABIO70_26385 [Pseudomonadota bacterium]
MVRLFWYSSVLALGIALASAAARAEPPAALEVRATVTVQDGAVWFRPGELLVGNPGLPGRPAVRPLADDRAATFPVEAGEFEDLSAGCAQPEEPVPGVAPSVLTRGDLGGDGRIEEVTVQRAAATTAPEVRVQRDAQLLAVGHLPVSAQPCRGLVAEVQPDGAPDLVVVWTSRGADGTSVGVTIFGLP